MDVTDKNKWGSVTENEKSERDGASQYVVVSFVAKDTASQTEDEQNNKMEQAQLGQSERKNS